MWVTTINGKEEKREDIEQCFMWYALFHKDFAILFEEGIIKRIELDRYEWTESDTSLAEYFNWVGKGVFYVPGGRWGPVAKTFRKDRRRLSSLASSNGNAAKPPESKGFKKIKPIVLQHREKARQQEIQDNKDRETFKAIKTLVHEAGNEDMRKIRAALEKIKIMLT